MLNVSLQGKEKLFTNLCDDISAFKMKLQLFVGQLEAGTLTNFPTLQSRSAKCVINLVQYKDKVQVFMLLSERGLGSLRLNKTSFYLQIHSFFPITRSALWNQTCSRKSLMSNAVVSWEANSWKFQPRRIQKTWFSCGVCFLPRSFHTYVHLHKDTFVGLVQHTDANSPFLPWRW